MKLALIRRQFSATGGAELYLQRLMGALVDAGHEVHLFAEAWTGQANDVRFHAVPVDGTRATKPLRFAESVRDLVARDSFDCVFSLERTLKQDVYRAGDGVHRVWLERRRQFAPWWKRPFIGMGAFHRNMMALEAQTFDPANTRRIIVNSNMVKGEILQHFKFPEERIHLVRNGVDVKRFQSGKRAKTRVRFGVKDDEFLLLFVGSGWERKGLKFVIKALSALQLLIAEETIEARIKAMLERAQGVLVGTENATPVELPYPHTRFKLLVAGKGKPFATLGAEVVFAGALTDVENACAAADLLAFPPIYEPSSNVVAEALAAGLPVITSAQNGASEWIEAGRNGTILEDPSDIPALVEAILFWMAHRPRKAVVSDYELSLERNVMETVELLEHTAREKAA